MRCSDFLTCTVVGFNFAYVTASIAIIGCKFIRDISKDKVRYGLFLLNTIDSDTASDYPWEFLYYARVSFVPSALTTVAMLISVVWVACIRPALCPGWRTSLCCRESTSILYVLLMIAYTGMILPGPIKAIKTVHMLKANDNVSDPYKQALLKSLHRLAQTYYTDYNAPSVSSYRSSQFGALLDYFQTKHSCCGIADGYHDYVPHFRDNFSVLFPLTCCSKIAQQGDSLTNASWSKCYRRVDGFYHKDPCFEHILEQCREGYFTLSSVGLSASIVGMLAVVYSLASGLINIVFMLRTDDLNPEGNAVRRRPTKKA